MAKSSRSEKLSKPEPAPSAPAPASVPKGGSGFIDVDTLQDANGLVAIISQRRSNAVLTLGVFKTFERDGVVERTSFIPEPLFEAYNALTKLAQERIAEIREKDLAPIKIEHRGAYAR